MLIDRNLYTDNISTFASTSKHYIAPLPVTHLNANASNNSCEISSNDYSTLPSNQNDKLTTQTVLNAITTAIGKHMSPMITSTNKRKRMVERPYGESLTSVKAYLKVQEKENKRKKGKPASKKTTAKSGTTTTTDNNSSKISTKKK
ncbi:unnamed protein product [Rotaria magnacalcarata]